MSTTAGCCELLRRVLSDRVTVHLKQGTTICNLCPAYDWGHTGSVLHSGNEDAKT